MPQNSCGIRYQILAPFGGIIRIRSAGRHCSCPLSLPHKLPIRIRLYIHHSTCGGFCQALPEVFGDIYNFRDCAGFRFGFFISATLQEP